MKILRFRTLATLVGFFSIALTLTAQDIASFEKRITVKKLANGMTIVLMERPEAPVFSFYTRVNAGSVQEVLCIN